MLVLYCNVRIVCWNNTIIVFYCFRYNNKTYRVDDIEWNMNPKNEFEMADGTKISYKEYYLRQYNKEIKDSNQPLLVRKCFVLLKYENLYIYT